MKYNCFKEFELLHPVSDELQLGKLEKEGQKMSKQSNSGQTSKKTKNSFTRILGLTLIIVGIGIVIWNFIPDFLIGQYADTNQQNIHEITAEQIEKNVQNPGEIDYGAVDEVSAESTLNDASEIPMDYISGQLVIPSVGMDLPIYHTLNNETLLAGSAIMREDQVMGEGNYPVAGHYTHTSDFLFGPLRDLEKGAVIRLTDKQNIYEYTYVDHEVVPPTALEMLEDERANDYSGPIISLMQCYYVEYTNTGDREFFIGELTDVFPYSEKALYE